MKALAGQRSGRVQHEVAEKMDCIRQPRTSISHKLNILLSGSLAACAASTRSSSLVLRRFWAASLTAFAAALSREPKCFSGGIFLSKASGGCMGSYSALQVHGQDCATVKPVVRVCVLTLRPFRRT